MLVSYGVINHQFHCYGGPGGTHGFQDMPLITKIVGHAASSRPTLTRFFLGQFVALQRVNIFNIFNIPRKQWANFLYAELCRYMI